MHRQEGATGLPRPPACVCLIAAMVAMFPPATHSAESSGDDWSQWRGPDGMGVSTATGLPLHWGPDQHIAWKTPLPGAGASTPIVHGNHVYLTCYTGHAVPGEASGSLEDLQRHLIAIDRNTGKILWRRTVPARLPEEERIRDHGYAANSPVADDERVYVFLGKSGVFAYNHDGEQQWATDVGEGTSGWGTSASPVLHGDLLIINACVEDKSLIALNRHTGERVWRAPGIEESWNTPIVAKSQEGREELLVATLGWLKAFDPDRGTPVWSCSTDITWYMVPSMVVADGVAYSLGGRSGISALAVRLGGTGDVTASHRLWTVAKGSNVSSPVYLDGHLYWAHDQRGVAYCAKAETGEIVYEERLERAGQIYASALLADGRLYYLNRRGKMFVVAAQPKFEVLAVNDLGEADRSQFNGSPIVAGSHLLIRSDNFLYCVGP